MSKQNMDLMEMFNILIRNKLTPDQFYFLYSCREKISPVGINLEQNLRQLAPQWIVQDIKDPNNYLLTAKTNAVIQEIEGFFKVQKKKTAVQLMGEEYHKQLELYNSCFPKLKLPSGKPGRSDIKSIETAMRWFFENYSYSWETILKATDNYVAEYERKRYQFMMTSQYFIRKQNTDKTWKSELADWCSMCEDGEDYITEKSFPDRVV